MTPFFVTSCEIIPFYDVAKEKKKLVTREEITLTHSLPSILINFFILKNLVFFYIVFKCTGTKIISLYLQYVTHLIFTHTSYTYVAVVVLSCCTVVFWLGSVGVGIRTCLDRTRCRLHSSFFCDLRASTCGLGPWRDRMDQRVPRFRWLGAMFGATP